MNLTQDDLCKVAAWELNGREIQNAVRTTRLWCSYHEGRTFDLKSIEAAIQVTAPFAAKEAAEDELGAGEASHRPRKRPCP